MGAASNYRRSLGGNYPYAARYIAAAGLTNTTQVSAIKQLVNTLLQLGLLHPISPGLSKLKALWPILGGTAAAHSINLLDARAVLAAHALSYQGGVTHSATGMRFDGIDGFADTNLSLASVLTSTNVGFGAYLRDDQSGRGGYRVDFGVISNANYTSLNVNSGGKAYFGAASGEIAASRPGTQGLWLVQHNASAAQCWLNGNLLASDSSLGILHDVNIGLGGCYLNNGPPDLFATNEHALAFACEALTPGEISSFTSAIQTYQTALGRQV